MSTVLKNCKIYSTNFSDRLQYTFKFSCFNIYNYLTPQQVLVQNSEHRLFFLINFKIILLILSVVSKLTFDINILIFRLPIA